MNADEPSNGASAQIGCPIRDLVGFQVCHIEYVGKAVEPVVSGDLRKFVGERGYIMSCSARRLNPFPVATGVRLHVTIFQSVADIGRARIGLPLPFGALSLSTPIRDVLQIYNFYDYIW